MKSILKFLREIHTIQIYINELYEKSKISQQVLLENLYNESLTEKKLEEAEKEYHQSFQILNSKMQARIEQKQKELYDKFKYKLSTYQISKKKVFINIREKLISELKEKKLLWILKSIQILLNRQQIKTIEKNIVLEKDQKNISFSSRKFRYSYESFSFQQKKYDRREIKLKTRFNQVSVASLRKKIASNIKIKSNQRISVNGLHDVREERSFYIYHLVGGYLIQILQPTQIANLKIFKLPISLEPNNRSTFNEHRQKPHLISDKESLMNHSNYSESKVQAQNVSNFIIFILRNQKLSSQVIIFTHSYINLYLFIHKQLDYFQQYLQIYLNIYQLSKCLKYLAGTHKKTRE